MGMGMDIGGLDYCQPIRRHCRQPKGEGKTPNFRPISLSRFIKGELGFVDFGLTKLNKSVSF
jgi:hypothetical protein